MPASTCRRAYDHRMRDLVCEERDPGLFHHLRVPRSTAVSWIRRGPGPVVSGEVLTLDHAELQAEVLALRRRVRFLLAIIRLAFLLVRLSGFRLDAQRVHEGETKRSILAAIASAQKAIPLAVALRVLALRAQRMGRVFAAVSTWARLIRERGWLRPRRRLYHDKPQEGIRASRPNECWHIDVTVIKLLDGTRTYLHAAIDNFSHAACADIPRFRVHNIGTPNVVRVFAGG
jgi:hypothetical protein